MFYDVFETIKKSGALYDYAALAQQIARVDGVLDCSVLKKPRNWEADSYILKYETGVGRYCVKIYPDYYPQAAQMYAQPHFLDKLFLC